MHEGRNRNETIKVVGWVWYRGEAFRGFQKQPSGPTVQEALGQALSKLGILNVMPMPAGRTDAGVHARMQVLSLRLPQSMPLEKVASLWKEAIGSDALGVAMIKKAPPGFHAQWQAKKKEYRYRVALGPLSPNWASYAWHPHEEERLKALPLPSSGRLRELLSACVGTHDFLAFHEKSSVRKLRTIEKAEWVELAPGLGEARLVGDSFARYQVRYLIGGVVATAMGLLPESLWRQALSDATPMAGVKAPGKGLTLWEVGYPREVDPFSPEERREALGVPRVPPFFDGY